MNELKLTARDNLEGMFRERVTFDRIERKLYSHDIAELPRPIKPLMGRTSARAVVQPVSEAELVELINWSREHRVPLVPRGKSTSGYGGVLPFKGAVVVDFHRLCKILAVDREAQTVTVEPGIVWEALDKELKRHGMTLPLYPTSYLASTPGGWLAMGGAGIGSYEAGWFRDNVISARIVLPTGEVTHAGAQDLDIYADARGITGMISQITLKTRPDQEMEVAALGTKNPADVQNLYQAIIEERLPI